MAAAGHVTLRPVTEHDTAFMVRLFLALAFQRDPTGKGIDVRAIVDGTQHATLEQARGDVAHSVTYVIEVDGRRAGRMRVVRDGQRIEIAGLQVLPSLQNMGVGTTVVSEVLAEGAGTGLPVELQVEHDNPGARRLYERLGFIPFATAADGLWMRVQARRIS